MHSPEWVERVLTSPLPATHELVKSNGDLRQYVLLPSSYSVSAASTTFTMAQDAPVPPTMTLLYSMEVLLGDRFSIGSVPTGQERIVIPIVGGTFKGPRMSGK